MRGVWKTYVLSVLVDQMIAHEKGLSADFAESDLTDGDRLEFATRLNDHWHFIFRCRSQEVRC